MGGPSRRQLSETLPELGRYLDSRAEFDGAPALLTLKRPRGYRGPWPMLLLWCVSASALVVFVAPGQWQRPRRAEVEGPATATYERWTRGREQSQVRDASVDLPAGRWSWIDRGPATSIAYRSDKFHEKGETVDYEHKFGAGVRLYQLGAESGALAWRGGNLRITAHGIEG